MNKNKLLQKIANTLYLTSQCVTSFGLLNGRMGIIIFLYQYSRYSKDLQYSDLADSMLDSIIEKVNEKTALSFSEGLSGIAWGINYLIHEKFVDADDDILDEADELIRKKGKDNLSDDLNSEIPLFSKGLYFASRNLKEDMLESLQELESFILSNPIISLPSLYLKSVDYFLSQMLNFEIVQERCISLKKSIPSNNNYRYWDKLLYKSPDLKIPEMDEEFLSVQIDNIIKDIHYNRLGLNSGLAGLGLMLLQ
jgi:hypothetical protein